MAVEELVLSSDIRYRNEGPGVRVYVIDTAKKKAKLVCGVDARGMTRQHIDFGLGVVYKVDSDWTVSLIDPEDLAGAIVVNVIVGDSGGKLDELSIAHSVLGSCRGLGPHWLVVSKSEIQTSYYEPLRVELVDSSDRGLLSARVRGPESALNDLAFNVLQVTRNRIERVGDEGEGADYLLRIPLQSDIAKQAPGNCLREISEWAVACTASACCDINIRWQLEVADIQGGGAMMLIPPLAGEGGRGTGCSVGIVASLLCDA